jgi:hypothetical protein
MTEVVERPRGQLTVVETGNGASGTRPQPQPAGGTARFFIILHSYNHHSRPAVVRRYYDCAAST